MHKSSANDKCFRDNLWWKITLLAKFVQNCKQPKLEVCYLEGFNSLVILFHTIERHSFAKYPCCVISVFCDNSRYNAIDPTTAIYTTDGFDFEHYLKRMTARLNKRLAQRINVKKASRLITKTDEHKKQK